MHAEKFADWEVLSKNRAREPLYDGAFYDIWCRKCCVRWVVRAAYWGYQRIVGRRFGSWVPVSSPTRLLTYVDRLPGLHDYPVQYRVRYFLLALVRKIQYVLGTLVQRTQLYFLPCYSCSQPAQAREVASTKDVPAYLCANAHLVQCGWELNWKKRRQWR